MKKTLFVLFALLILPLTFAVTLDAAGVKKVYPEQPFIGNEPTPVVPDGGAVKRLPPTARLFQVGTVIDSTMMDHQSNATLHSRIAAVGDSAMHLTAMVSPDPGYTQRGMKYYYYINGLFTNFNYVEGSGTGNQRGGYGSVVSYYAPDRGIGNIAVMTSHTNLDNRTFPQLMHWYDFQDAFQGVGAFTPYEGDWGDGVSLCDEFLWPSLYVTNDLTGRMAMTGVTFDAACTGGFDDIAVIYKNFDDAVWSEALLLDSLEDPADWVTGADVPMLAGADNGYFYIAAADFATNIYYWESTDAGVTWSDRLDVTGFPLVPHHVPPDTSSNEYRPLQNAAISVTTDGIPHIVWTAYQAQGSLPDSMFTPGSGLYQYRTKLEHWDPINGITTIYRHPNGLSNFAGGTAFAYNVGHPNIGFGETGDIIYVVYEGFVDADQDFSNGLYYGDVYVSVSTDGGVTWMDRVNITNSPGSDDLYPAVARTNIQGAFSELTGFSVGNADGVNDFILLYQNDDVAGTFSRGDEPSANWDMLLVAPVDCEDIPEVGGIDDGGPEVSIPKSFALNQNYPNPFNPSTSITYRLAERANVSVRIHNIRGQLVRELVNGMKEAGEYTVQWNGRNEMGSQVSSGIYLYTLQTDKGFESTRKMVVLK